MSLRLLGEYFFPKGAAAAGPASEGAPIFASGDFRELRLGATVDFSPAVAAFILAKDAGSVFDPPAGPLQVAAHGLITEVDGILIHRFYLAAAGKPSHLLEISTQRGVLMEDETRLLKQVADFAPASADEWDQWLEGVDGDPPLLGGISLNWQGAAYGRAWGVNDQGEGPDAVEPRDLQETVQDRSGASHTVDMSTMLYGRAIGDKTEWLTVAAMLQSASGSEDERWIEAYLGLGVTAQELQIY